MDRSVPVQFTAGSIDEMGSIARKIVENGKGYAVWLLRGEMGAGKTTLAKEIGKVLELEDEVNSPTFALVNEYRAPRGEPVYHFDFYRIGSEAEAEAIGVEEYLYSGHHCLIEWPEKIRGLWPDRYMMIDIQTENQNERHFKLSYHD